MNTIKTCTRCGESGPIEGFRKNARYADGHVTWCMPCQKSYRAGHYQIKKAAIKAQNAAWHQANKESRNASMRAAYKADPDRHAARVDAAKKRNPEMYREANKLNARKRRAERVDVRLRSRVSSQLRYCLGTGKGGKTTQTMLGYPVSVLRSHLERQFLQGMSWGNMGEWHIDHITPLASFTITGPDDPELKRAWSLANLRPLWAADNIRKGAKMEMLL